MSRTPPRTTPRAVTSAGDSGLEAPSCRPTETLWLTTRHGEEAPATAVTDWPNPPPLPQHAQAPAQACHYSARVLSAREEHPVTVPPGASGSAPRPRVSEAVLYCPCASGTIAARSRRRGIGASSEPRRLRKHVVKLTLTRRRVSSASVTAAIVQDEGGEQADDDDGVGVESRVSGAEGSLGRCLSRGNDLAGGSRPRRMLARSTPWYRRGAASCQSAGPMKPEDGSQPASVARARTRVRPTRRKEQRQKTGRRAGMKIMGFLYLPPRFVDPCTAIATPRSPPRAARSASTLDGRHAKY